ncbi:hypothetical protein EYC84_009269 [Monilinia fructicola]|uniref:Solute-binding protein family 5 domain-containing protein n=1 Tax=Monilinia fructicola TaxID=38448 RepID=A0A5M9JFL4_MONFR|nr:hypothetical protein EYC84_009269 [Monilinia fructicola]
MTDTLRIGLEKVDFRLPTQVTDDNSILTLKNWVFEPLLRWESGGLVKPALFSHWTHSKDGREWSFRIRNGAVFHDGVPCVARHIINFIEGILDSRDTFGMRWSYYRYFQHTQFTAEGNEIVKVENPKPIADVLDIFTEFYICRITDNGKPILGTGRYRVEEFDGNEGSAVLELVKSDDGRGQIPRRIIATAEPSAEKRLLQLQEGQIDVALNLERVEEKLEFASNLQWGKTANTLSIIYYLNCNKGIFSNQKIRLAVNHAIDRETLIKDVFHDLAIPATTVVSPFHLGMRDANLKPIDYDIEQAKKLLQESGEDLSKPILLRTPTYMPERAEAITNLVVKALQRIGLEVQVDIETNRPEYARQVGLRKNIGDLALFDSSPHSTFRVLDDKISMNSVGVWWQGYQDDAVQQFLTLANGAVGDNEREYSYGKVLGRLRENPPWLFLVHPVLVFGARLGVRGLSLSEKGVLEVGGIEEEERKA